MDEFTYPTREGAIEVAKHLGVEPDDILSEGQDWEYTYPNLNDFDRYLAIYQTAGISDRAKRVLGCFLFETLEDHLRAGGNDERIKETLKMLFADMTIHKAEFDYWALLDTDYASENPDDWWFITKYVREYLTASSVT